MEKTPGEVLSGLNIIGYTKYAFGQSEATRCFARQLQNAHVPFCIYSIESPSHDSIPSMEEDIQSHCVTELIYPKNLFCINGNDLKRFFYKHHPLFFGKINSGVWWWEFDNGLDSCLQGFKFVNEIVVFTDFIQKALQHIAPPGFPIHKITYPFLKNWDITIAPEKIRNDWGWTPDNYILFYNFDYFSSYQRKNPEALLKAFKIAQEQNPLLKLFIKTLHASQSLPNKNKLWQTIRQHSLENDVKIDESVLSKNKFMSFLNACDCYISLHRGEGLGLGMLEAMALGKPVIATGYGGNLEFMNHTNSFLVDYKMVPANDDYLVYRNVKQWAQPNIENAVEYILRLSQARDFGIDVGKKAMGYVYDYFGLEKFSRDISNKILVQNDRQKIIVENCRTLRKRVIFNKILRLPIYKIYKLLCRTRFLLKKSVTT